MMDIKQLRDTGELSDFTVYIGKNRFKLHKFPLYTKSEYFKDVASTNPVCELSDFPGGSKTFSVIADFCYGKKIDINPSNIVFLRVGADDLRMRGKDNLLELTKRFMDELFLKIVDKEDFCSLLVIIIAANSLKAPIASRILEDAIHIVHSNLMTSTPSSQEDRVPASESLVQLLVYLPFDLLAQLVKEIGFDSPNNQYAYRLITKYLERVMENYFLAQHQKNTESMELSMKASDQRELIEKFYSENPTLKESFIGHTEQFDALFDLIQDENELISFVTAKWVIKALDFVESSQEKPKCRQKILRLAHQMLSQFTEDDLSGIEPTTVAEVISVFDKPAHRESILETFTVSRRSSRRFSKAIIPPDVPEEENNYEAQSSSRRESWCNSASEQEKESSPEQLLPKMLPNSVTKAMVKYLDQKAKDEHLRTDEFIRLFKKMDVEKEEDEVSDSLVRILAKLKSIDREMTEQEQINVTQRVDLSKCTTETLTDALNKDVLPAKLLAEAAIKVAEREKAKQTVPQEKEQLVNEVPKSTTTEEVVKDESYKYSKLSASPNIPMTSSLGLSPYLKGPWSRDYSRLPVTGRYTPSYVGWKSTAFTNNQCFRPMRPCSSCSYVAPSSTVQLYSPCHHPELSKTERSPSGRNRLLSVFEAELRKELSQVPTRAYSRALCNTYLSSPHM